MTERAKMKIRGVFDENGYSILDEDGTVLHQAGNNPHEQSPQSSFPGAAPLTEIAKWCDRTGREIAKEKGGEWDGLRFMGEQATITLSFNMELPLERIKDLLIGAFEGGSAYWASVEVTGARRSDEDYYDRLLRDPSVKCHFTDVEDGESLGYFNLEKAIQGLKLMASGKDAKGQKIPLRHWQDWLQENDDAETADVFLQLSVMGEIVYG